MLRIAIISSSLLGPLFIITLCGTRTEAGCRIALFRVDGQPVSDAFVCASDWHGENESIRTPDANGIVAFPEASTGLKWIAASKFRPIGPLDGTIGGSLRVTMLPPIRLNIKLNWENAAIDAVLGAQVEACWVSLIGGEPSRWWCRAAPDDNGIWAIAERNVGNTGVDSGLRLMPPGATISPGQSSLDVLLPGGGEFAVLFTMGRRLVDSNIRDQGEWPSRTVYIAGPERRLGNIKIVDNRDDRSGAAMVINIGTERILELCAEARDIGKYSQPPGWSLLK